MEEEQTEAEWIEFCQDSNTRMVIEKLARHPNESVRRAAQDLGNSMAYWDDPVDPA